MQVHHISVWAPWSFCVIKLRGGHVSMFFRLWLLCWTCVANDLSTRNEVIYLMVCPRLIIWWQILVRSCELGPPGPSQQFLSSVSMWKSKQFMKIKWNEVIFSRSFLHDFHLDYRLLTCRTIKPLSRQTRWTWSACQTCQCRPRRVTKRLHNRGQRPGLSFSTHITKRGWGRNVEIEHRLG